jgi:hypothetical protein
VLGPTVQGVAPVTNQAEIETWVTKDLQAQQLIYYNIEPTYQSSIEGSVTAQEMWQRLLAEFADVAASNDRSLLGKFHSYRMNPGETCLEWWLLIQKNKSFLCPKRP